VNREIKLELTLTKGMMIFSFLIYVSDERCRYEHGHPIGFRTNVRSRAVV
jgi:hypothetical protein